MIALGALALFSARPATAGALLGLAIWARPLTAVIVVPLAAAALLKRAPDRRALLRFGHRGGHTAGGGRDRQHDHVWRAVGDVLRPHAGGRRIECPGVASHRALFTNTLATGVRLMFADREHGLGPNALPALVAVVGLLPLAWRNVKLAAALAIALAGFVAGYIHYRYFNARFFFAWQVLLIVPLAVLIADAGRWALAVGQAVHAARPRVSAAVRRLPRALVWGCLAALLVGGLVVRLATGRDYVLSHHVAAAKVQRNDLVCDYFNMTHLAWECAFLDRSANEHTGLAIHGNQCRFDGAHRRAIVIGPPPEGGTRRISFTPARRGQLVFEYGLEQGAAVAESCLSVAYGGRPPEQLCASGSGRWHRRVFDALGPAEPAVVDVVVTGRGVRSLCFDGTVEP